MAEIQGISLSGLRVLAVDDDRDTRELLTYALGAAGASVSAVASAGEALEVFSRESFAGVLRVNPRALAFYVAAGGTIVGESESHYSVRML